MKAIITGSGGLIGSACVRPLAAEGWDVVGVDNDMRQVFFGPAGSTEANVRTLCSTFPSYRRMAVDIRERTAVRDLLKDQRPGFLIHTAAQPSHDKAASIPYDDFDVNAGGTMNLLVAARDYCAESPFCFTSTNKVYGDRPNSPAAMGYRLTHELRDENRKGDHICYISGVSKIRAHYPEWKPEYGLLRILSEIVGRNLSQLATVS